MKTVAIIQIMLGAGIVGAAGLELGIFQRAFDSRSIVQDGVAGAPFLIERVDGKPVDRIQHGFLITRVPFALLEPGDRVLELSDARGGKVLVEFDAAIAKGVDYRISRNEAGEPELVDRK